MYLEFIITLNKKEKTNQNENVSDKIFKKKKNQISMLMEPFEIICTEMRVKE